MVAAEGQEPTLQPPLHCVLRIGPNQDRAPRPDAGWRCAVALLPRVTKRLHERLHILMADLRADDQPIPELPGPHRRPMAMRRDPERWMRLLIGPQAQPGPLDTPVPSLVMHLLPCPEFFHHLQGLDKLWYPFLAGDTPQRHLLEVIGQADTQVQAAATNMIECDHVIGDISRV